MEATVLDRILKEKRREVDHLKKTRPLEVVQRQALSAPAPRNFADSLRGRGETSGSGGGPGEPAFRIVAEVKKASPSRGLIREHFDPVAIAEAYEQGGAVAVSVLTDSPFFQGDLTHLEAVRGAVGIPVLRKDFLVDPYQVWEARAAGADAVLLIAAALDDATLRFLYELTRELGMDALVEVHDREEMERVARLEPEVVGVNNRNLRTFEVSLEVTRALLPCRPPGAILVSESGFSSREELGRLLAWGVDAFLIGESLMRAADPGAALAGLLEGERKA